MNQLYKYFIQDTLSIIGNFGIAINTYDKINNSPFKFGIYEIEMLIDNKKTYNINFDNYHFDQDPLIYREIDFHLLNEKSENFHRLFINHNETLDFIDNNSNYGLNLNKEFHNLIINISDNFQNNIQVQGIIKGDILINPESNFNINNLSLQFFEPINNIDFKLLTRYENSREIPITYTMYDSTIFIFEKPEKPYEVLKYYINKNGLKSHPEYISLFKYDPLEITGEFQLEHFDNNILIKFIENKFSGHNAKLTVQYKDNNNKSFNMRRLNKNTLSSGLLDLETLLNVDSIHIKYNSKPEIVFSKKINGKIIYKDKDNYFNYNKFSLKTDKESLYNDMFISVDIDYTKIPNTYNTISPAINIFPKNIPFKNKVKLSYNDNRHGALFQFKKDKWVYIQSSDIDSLSSDITTGGTFAILNEKNKPIISNLFPNYNSNYKLNDLNEISFNITDNQSGINNDEIEIKINGKKLYYNYIEYRKLVIAKINDGIKEGNNNLSISCKDNLGNTIHIKGNFTAE